LEAAQQLLLLAVEALEPQRPLGLERLAAAGEHRVLALACFLPMRSSFSMRSIRVSQIASR